MLAAGAPIYRRLLHPNLLRPTGWTNDSIRPPQTREIRPAGVLSRKPIPQLDCGSRIVGHLLTLQVVVRGVKCIPRYPYYTLLGDDQWGNYEVSADVLLNPGDTAGVMGRVNDIGNGDYAAPKGYFFSLGDDGLCQLVV